MTEEMRNDAQASRATLLEVEEDDFGDGAEAQWRTPGAGAAGGKDLQIAEAAEIIGPGAIEAGDEGSRRHHRGKAVASERVGQVQQPDDVGLVGDPGREEDDTEIDQLRQADDDLR